MIEAHKKFGVDAYTIKKVGRPSQKINSVFVEKVVSIRNADDYGSEKLHYVMKRDGFSVSRRQIQKILDQQGLTEPCEKRRGQRKYVRYQWPISNYMWHCDWTEYEGKYIIAFIDDRSRKIMAAGEFTGATKENTFRIFHQAMLMNQVCPVIMLSDKGTQFFVNVKNKKGERILSEFEQELRDDFGIELWTSRRNHPQTNGKVERWFETMKKRFKKHPEEILQDFVKWYNEKRIHHALHYQTPDEVYWSKL